MLTKKRTSKARVFVAGFVNDLLEARQEYDRLGLAYRAEILRSTTTWPERQKVLDALNARMRKLTKDIGTAYSGLEKALDELEDAGKE
jgi:hypothetical protein